jgi:hypothetical protein
MQIDEKNYLTKTIFAEALIENSSDFIVTLYSLSEMTDKILHDKINPIYYWEYKNWHNVWSDNVGFINKKLDNLFISDYDEILMSYTAVMEYFCDDNVVSNIYNMSSIDHIGWKIYKELNEKRQSVKRFKNLMIMKENI